MDIIIYGDDIRLHKNSKVRSHDNRISPAERPKHSSTKDCQPEAVLTNSNVPEVPLTQYQLVLCSWLLFDTAFKLRLQLKDSHPIGMFHLASHQHDSG